MSISLLKFIAAVTFTLIFIGLADAQTLKIGVLADQSSAYSDMGGSGSITAAKMAIADFGGSVLGRKIEIISADPLNKPDVGSAIAKRWIDVEGVAVIVDVPLSSLALAVQDITRNSKTALLVSSAGTSDLTGKACSPTTVHWTYDSYALAAGTARGVVQSGGKRWFFLTQDNAFGTALERDVTQFVTEAGGQVIGSVRHPLNTPDFASFLVTIQAAHPDVVAFADSGSDFINGIKQAGEFGLPASGIKMVGLSVFITDVHALGLKASQGLQFITPFYWDLTPESRKWSQRFFEREKKMPTKIQAGVYGAIMHYLSAVKAAGTSDGPTVVARMKQTPVNDFFTKNGRVREDGRVLREFHFMEVKTPAESKGPWDYYKLIRTLDADSTARPVNQSECPLLR
jgi:branched-chain amino acid transport system substrate-binding protein